MVAKAQAKIESKVMQLIADGMMELKAAQIKLNGSSDQAVLGKKMIDAFNKHTHTTTDAPTGKPIVQMNKQMILSQTVKLS